MISVAGRIARRTAGVLAALCALLILVAGPAGADGVGPTNFRSVVDSVKPDPPGLAVSVVGEDSFLQVVASRGTTVEIPGYDGEQYLRISDNGTVQRNRNSSSTYLNNSRSGKVKLPPNLDEKASPDWETISTDGTVAWHDHRIHYMASGSPDVGDGGLVQAWQVPMTVNGHEITVSGSLFHDDDSFPWPGLLAVAAAVTAAVLIRRHGSRWATPTIVVSAALALAVSVGFAWENPTGSGASWLPIVLPTLAIFAGLATRLVPPSTQPILRTAPLLAAVALLVGWAVPVLGVLWKPNIPSLFPGIANRLLVGLVFGVAAGAAAAVIAWPDPTPARSPVGADPGS